MKAFLTSTTYVPSSLIMDDTQIAVNII